MSELDQTTGEAARTQRRRAERRRSSSGFYHRSCNKRALPRLPGPLQLDARNAKSAPRDCVTGPPGSGASARLGHSRSGPQRVAHPLGCVRRSLGFREPLAERHPHVLCPRSARSAIAMPTPRTPKRFILHSPHGVRVPAKVARMLIDGSRRLRVSESSTPPLGCYPAQLSTRTPVTDQPEVGQNRQPWSPSPPRSAAGSSSTSRWI